MHIWNTAVGPYRDPNRFREITASSEAWSTLARLVAREAGLPYLGDSPYDNPQEQCQKHLAYRDTDSALDIIEMSFRMIDGSLRRLDDYTREQSEITQGADDAIEELNARFREHSIGYQYNRGELIRVDSEYLHEETVRPALRLLSESAFAGAEAEFRRALQHYRAGEKEQAMAECLKAFESTMKIICDIRRWTCAATATAKDLIEVVFDRGLIPSYLASEFAALRSVLESGLPTVSNRAARHGQGSEVRDIPDYLASFCMHATATNILLLCEAHKAKARE